jgi:LysM repeat protein
MPDQTQSQARLLAPIALAICAIALLAIVVSSGGGDGGADRAPTAERQTTRKAPSKPRVVAPTTYTVKIGDTLGKIAVETGVPVDKLEELNPELDPQGLVSGQKIKLRE